MLRFLVKRVFYIIFVLFIVAIGMFVLFQFMPGDPALVMMEGMQQDMTPEQFAEAYARAREIMGLDEPVFTQFFIWMGNMLTGNFGYSFLNRAPVLDVIAAPMRWTFTMNIMVMILVFIVTIPVGIYAAIKRGKMFDNGALVFTMVGFSFPAFLFALILILIFAIFLQWLPINGMASMPPPPEGTLTWYLDRLRFMALPMMALTLGGMAGMMRFVRASMIDALNMDCIRTARSKGLGAKIVVYSHAFRNALIPIITVMTGFFIGIFSGSVVIERTFSWNGMGDVMLSALSNQDWAVVMSMNVFYALISFVVLLFMDIAYVIADPRIRFE